MVLKRGNLAAGMVGDGAYRFGEGIRDAGGRVAYPSEDAMCDLAALVTELVEGLSRCEHMRRQYGRDEQMDFVAAMSRHPLAVLTADKLARVRENQADIFAGGVKTLIDKDGSGDTVTIALG